MKISSLVLFTCILFVCGCGENKKTSAKVSANKELTKPTISKESPNDDFLEIPFAEGLEMKIKPTRGKARKFYRPYEEMSMYMTLVTDKPETFYDKHLLELKVSGESRINGKPIGEAIANNISAFGGKNTLTWYLGFGANQGFIPRVPGKYLYEIVLKSEKGSWRTYPITILIQYPPGEEVAYQDLEKSEGKAFFEHYYGIRPTDSNHGTSNYEINYLEIMRIVTSYDADLLKSDIHQRCLNTMGYDLQHSGKYETQDKKYIASILKLIDPIKPIKIWKLDDQQYQSSYKFNPTDQANRAFWLSQLSPNSYIFSR